MDKGMSPNFASVAFVDLAGFSAITDVFGDESAIAILEIFEGMVGEALEEHEPPIKWIGDEAMLAFPEPEVAIQALGKLLQACRNEPRLPLTRAGLHHGPVIRRAGDIFGSTVNIAARITALQRPANCLRQSIAEIAVARAFSCGSARRRCDRWLARFRSSPSNSLRNRTRHDRSGVQDTHPRILPKGRSRRTVVLFPRCEEAYWKLQTYPLVRIAARAAIARKGGAGGGVGKLLLLDHALEEAVVFHG